LKTKIYLNEWFVNAGIVGFIRILEHNNDNFLIVKDNYIEFDIENLKNFHKYYFKYFFEKYNVGDKIKTRVDASFGKIKKYLEDDSGKKEIKDKLKTEKKYIKSFLKPQMDKLKKIDEESYQEVQEAYNEIDKIKEKEDAKKLSDLQKKFIQNFYNEHVNKKITLNLFKSILSNTYFGQPRFFECG